MATIARVKRMITQYNNFPSIVADERAKCIYMPKEAYQQRRAAMRDAIKREAARLPKSDEAIHLQAIANKL